MNKPDEIQRGKDVPPKITFLNHWIKFVRKFAYTCLDFLSCTLSRDQVNVRPKATVYFVILSQSITLATLALPLDYSSVSFCLIAKGQITPGWSTRPSFMRHNQSIPIDSLKLELIGRLPPICLTHWVFLDLHGSMWPWPTRNPDYCYWVSISRAGAKRRSVTEPNTVVDAELN